MMILRVKITFLAVILATINPVYALAEKEPLRLLPSSKWELDYSDDHCRLGRQFGLGEQEMLVFFDRFGPGEEFRITVSGKLTKIFNNQVDANIQFGPDEKEQVVSFAKGSIGKNTPAIISFGKIRVEAPIVETPVIINKKGAKNNEPQIVSKIFPPVSTERLAAIKYLSINSAFNRNVVFQTGPMLAPFKAFDTCVDELMTHWGIDVEKHKALMQSVIPRGYPGDWLTTYDYPVEMLRQGQPAIIEFRLNVGIDGKPTNCNIQLTTRPKEFDAAVCKALMKKARFEPALDASGQPLPSYWRSTARFALPG
jgi:Gram-negative bacterial TonB protein C-terminal